MCSLVYRFSSLSANIAEKKDGASTTNQKVKLCRKFIAFLKFRERERDRDRERERQRQREREREKERERVREREECDREEKK